jgi:hypothetical protein
MRIEFLSELDVRYHTNPDSGRRWTLQAPLMVRVDGFEIAVPVGFWTDFASVPRFIWPIISPYDLGRAPVLHDFMYFIGYHRDKGYADEAFREGMIAEGVVVWKRVAAYLAVSWFAGRVWDRYRRENQTYRLAIVNGRFGVGNWRCAGREEVTVA